MSRVGSGDRHADGDLKMKNKKKVLGRHFGCRPLDPTLDIWSNFVKKRKRKKKKSILPPYNLKITNVALVTMSQGFPRVTKSYHRLPQVTTGYCRLPKVTAGYHRLPQVTTGYHRLPQVTLPQTPVFPILTNHYIKLSRCRPIVRMKFGHFFH